MADDDVTCYVKISRDLDERLDEWVVQMNKTVGRFGATFTKPQAVRVLIDRGLLAMREEAEAAAEEAKLLDKREQQRAPRRTARGGGR